MENVPSVDRSKSSGSQFCDPLNLIFFRGFAPQALTSDCCLKLLFLTVLLFITKPQAALAPEYQLRRLLYIPTGSWALTHKHMTSQL